MCILLCHSLLHTHTAVYGELFCLLTIFNLVFFSGREAGERRRWGQTGVTPAFLREAEAIFSFHRSAGTSRWRTEDLKKKKINKYSLFVFFLFFLAGRKPEDKERTLAGTGRMCQLCIKPHKEPSCSEAPVHHAADPCDSNRSQCRKLFIGSMAGLMCRSLTLRRRQTQIKPCSVSLHLRACECSLCMSAQLCVIGT